MSFRFPAPRVVVGLTVLALLLVDLHALMSTLQAHGAVRERAFRSAESRLLAARPHLVGMLGPSGAGAVEPTVEQVLAMGLGSAAEIRALNGRRLSARPADALPAGMRAAGLGDEALLAGGVRLTGTALGGSVIGEMALRAPPETVILAVSMPLPEVVQDLQARRVLLLGQGLTLVLLLVLGGVALLPTGGPNETTPSHALLAYEAAMERLRWRGEELSVRHERERQRLFDEAEDREALARAGELTAGIVHEVRNGLGTVLGYARLLEKGQDAEARAHGQSIREECETLETVVRRFVDFVKRESLAAAPFDLSRMLGRVAAREQRGRPGATVTVSTQAALTLVGDEELLERAFENIVRNAREAAGASGTVVIEASRTDSEFAISVADDGPGLDAATRDGLRPFFTTKAGGFGLGLPIALKVLRLHGGGLELIDRRPRGLIALVHLPVTPYDGGVTEGNEGRSAVPGSV